MAQPARSNQPAPNITNTPKSATTVTVACKVPNGVVLQLCRKVGWTEETRNGSKQRERWDKFGERVVVRGPAYPVGTPPEGFKPAPIIAGGYALTPGVPAEFWEQYAEQNKLNPLIKNKMLFALPRAADARAMAVENKETRSGLEPLNPRDDARMPKPMVGVEAITPSDDMVGRAGFDE